VILATPPPPPVMPRIGVIGTGTVGTAVASALLKAGHAVSVHDKFRASAEPLLALGARWQPSPAALAAEIDVLVTALPAPQHVRAVMEGDDGALAALSVGALWIDHTSTDPDEPVRFAAICSQMGLRYVEAPITGGVTLLRAGKMTVYLAGDPEDIEATLSYVSCYTATQLPMGLHGTAAVAKIISNMMCATHTVITAEALMMAKKSGVDLKSFFDAIRLSAGNSYVFETEAPLVFNQTFDPHFTLALHCKDLGIGYDISKRVGAPIEVMGLAEQIYNRARCKYGDDKGSSFPAKLLQDDLRESLMVEGFEQWKYTIEKVEPVNPEGEDNGPAGIVIVHQGIKPRSKL
jgi:3-hydroxyisobutyrate dehydrogenase